MLHKGGYGPWFILFITILKLPCFKETWCNCPHNYSTVMITCGQVPSVPWYAPEGFHTMRSALHLASDVLLQIYLETWSLRWERPSDEEHIWHYNSMTSPFFFLFLFLSVQPRFAVFLFVLKRGSSACIKFCLAFTIWCIDLCSVARPQPFILELSSTSSFISHPPLELNDITWGLHLIKVLYSCDGGWHCVGFR